MLYFYLTKILPLLVLPLGIVIGCLVVGIVRRRRSLVVIAAVILWVSSTPLVSRPLMRSLEGRFTRLSASEAPLADAIVVLSGGRVLAPGPAAISEWTDADRFFGGIELFKAGKSPLLVFTGGIVTGAPGETLEGETLARYAVEFAVPAPQVITTGRVVNTAEEASAVASLLGSRGILHPRILLVTSAYHVPRATRLFERQGITVLPFAVDFSGSRAASMGVLQIFPSVEAFGQTHVALREWYGRWYYALFS